jgi:UDP-GlcNAc3NAcA epimerase
VHRAENTGDVSRLREIVTALTRVAAAAPVVLPLHPRTRGSLERFGLSTEALEVTEPLSYLHMLALIMSCRAVLTDSGGLQREAHFLGKPSVTLRETTEWPELVEAGRTRLAGADAGRIVEALGAIEVGWPPPASAAPLHGRGDAAARIATLLIEALAA